MSFRLAAVTAAVTLSLAGCAAAPSTPSPFAAPVITVPAGPVPSDAEAAATYLKLCAAPNAARDAWMNAPAPADGDFDRLRRLAAKAADANATFAEGLRSHRWPAAAQPAVTALAGQIDERVAAYRRVASAGTARDYLVAAADVPVTTSVSGDVRRALGLPEGAVVTGAAPRR